LVRKRSFPLSIAGAVLLASARISFADEAADKSAAESLVKAFISTCVQSVPDLDKVEGTAKLFGWKEMTGIEGTLLAAPNPNAKGKAWLVQDVAEVPFMLAVSRGEEGGESIAVCTVVNPYAPVAPIRIALTAFLQLGEPLKAETEGGQRYTYWQTKFSENYVLVSLIDASPVNDPGINLSAAVKQAAT
jgi:hypothetical protein